MAVSLDLQATLCSNSAMDKQDTMLDFLRAWPFLPTREGKGLGFASGAERRRWFERGSVEVNGEKSVMGDPWPTAGSSVVLHPNGKHRTTLL